MGLNMNVLFGIVGLGAGIYGFYAYYLMQKSGEINTTLLLPQGIDIKKCKDKAAYIAEAKVPLLVFSVFAILYGAVELIEAQFHVLGRALIANTGVFLVILVWFAIRTSQLRKKYF